MKFTNSASSVSSMDYNPVRSTLGIFFRSAFAVVLFIFIFRLLGGSTHQFTFTALLNSLHDVPQIDTTWLMSVRMYGDSIRELPLIGYALGFLVDVFTALCFGAIAVLQVLRYIVWIARFLFV